MKVDKFLHVHVIPSNNDALLKKKYKCSGKDMETTWRDHINDQSKYQIITPENLLNGLYLTANTLNLNLILQRDIGTYK